MQKTKLQFEETTHPTFYRELKRDLSAHLTAIAKSRFATPYFWCKAALNITIMMIAYLAMVLGWVTSPLALLGCAVTFGVASLLLIFNVAHDAVHGTLSPKRWVNVMIYRMCFVFVGISGRLWAMRHLHSHHVFTNVNGSDVDIDENPFLRLSPNHPRRSYQRFQHLYAPLVYWIALPHTTFYQDFIYLFKRELANMRDITHPWYEYVLFGVEKFIYVTMLLVIPLATINLPTHQILIGYAIMAMAVSTLFVFTLVGTHFTMETSFPAPDEKGVLPGSWAMHVVKTCLDWNPSSRLATAVFGGANAHVAHHLFPSVNHVHYVKCTALIRQSAHLHRLPYQETTLLRMMRSHFAFLRQMANT
jgi:linoleoyl-CoA desaturase